MLIRCRRGVRFPLVRGSALLLRLLPLAATVAAGWGILAAPVNGRTPAPGPAPQREPLVFAPDIASRLRQLPRTRLDYDHSLLDEKESRTLNKLLDICRMVDEVYMRQVSEENPALRISLLEQVGKRPDILDAFNYFIINKGRWDRLKGNEPFIGSRPKPPGAAFYPPDMTKEEFERWLAAHPEDKEKFQSLFTVIRRDGDRLVAVPYSKHYEREVTFIAKRLREAAALTGNASLKNYLTLLATALGSDDYFASDMAWMDLDSEIEVVLGPYEVYEDGLFNYKAAFEAFVTVRDKAESARLAAYAAHLPDMEKNLPIPEKYKNFNRKFESPIRVVQEAMTAGDARTAVQTAAFNLPNDERVRQAKGSKKVLLKNVMEAKFRGSGLPIAQRVLDPSQANLPSFDAYFNHTLFHELSHGLGPGVITGPDGKKVEARLLLKNLYSTIEECKADVLGVWNILYGLDQKWLKGFTQASLFATDAGLMFRSMRFGLEEAHGGGTAVQWNWYREKKAIEPTSGGRFRVRTERLREAVRSLATELLAIEATGDFERAQRLLGNYGKITPEIQATIARLSDIPVDIAPVFAAAGEK
jgi:hypothetical protein